MTQDEQERQEFRKKLNELWKCILGNGHPEEGLKWKVEQNTNRIEEIHEFMQVVKGVFWKVVGTAVLGAFSALCLLIWKVVALLINHELL